MTDLSQSYSRADFDQLLAHISALAYIRYGDPDTAVPAIEAAILLAKSSASPDPRVIGLLEEAIRS